MFRKAPTDSPHMELVDLTELQPNVLIKPNRMFLLQLHIVFFINLDVNHVKTITGVKALAVENQKG